MAAERRGGRGAANSFGKGAGSARPPRRTHARRAPPARWPGRLAAAERPAPTVRTLAEEEPPRPPRDARPPEASRGPLEGAGEHLFLQLGVREPRRGTRSVPLPHDERGGRFGACYRESAPDFPAHFNSVSASTARRFTPAGAPEPSAGTRCATPSHFPPPPERKVSSHPSSPSSVLGPASTLYFLRVPTRAGPSSSRGTPDSGRAEELLNVSVRPAVRRARSSSWKLPPRGARRAGRPGGRGARQAPPPHLPGGGLDVPALLPAEGRGERGRGGRGSRGGGRFPPHPASRTTGSRCCPLPPAAASTEASGGAAAVGTGPGTHALNLPGVAVRKLAATFEKPVAATWAPHAT